MKTLSEFAQTTGQAARIRDRRCGVCRLPKKIRATIDDALKQHTASATTIYRWLSSPDGPQVKKGDFPITHSTCRNHQVAKHYENPS